MLFKDTPFGGPLRGYIVIYNIKIRSSAFEHLNTIELWRRSRY